MAQLKATRTGLTLATRLRAVGPVDLFFRDIPDPALPPGLKSSAGTRDGVIQPGAAGQRTWHRGHSAFGNPRPLL